MIRILGWIFHVRPLFPGAVFTTWSHSELERNTSRV